MSEPTTKVKRLAYVRVQAPDVEEGLRFLEEFGLVVALRDGASIYLRGTNPDPYCYVLSQGAPGVHAIAFEADTRADLEAVAGIPGASAIEKLEGPGGGEVVRLTDPQGMTVEIVHGLAALDAISPGPSHELNMNGVRTRMGGLPAIENGPSHVRRIGHLVLESADPVAVYDWYHAHLGLRKADEVQLPDGRVGMRFAALDRGAEYVDHHVVGFQFALDEGARVQHVAFEVANFDDLMAGHDHLKRRRRKSVWGVGRHRFGGQIYDYWGSPLGVIHEHWTDTDLVNDTHEPSVGRVDGLGEYWGPPPGPAFVVSRWNLKVFANLFGFLRARLRGGRSGAEA